MDKKSAGSGPRFLFPVSLHGFGDSLTKTLAETAVDQRRRMPPPDGRGELGIDGSGRALGPEGR